MIFVNSYIPLFFFFMVFCIPYTALNLISCDVDHFLTKLVFNIANGPECLSGLGDRLMFG